ncbi:PID-CTERM protein-sorting domain-containing protein [Neotamlana laminarinivorans]|uniref:MYXO-CTERM domain-containing protein n=1 Tax=Neotamlana laminarinivorans TaxID=2883124 RepID=A0A9X1HXT7_9FLAO|nr:hypothetical protein [Tamlana laminarinivorans]MCB4798124.1 hypothetical protein [Tamlana laminarinivorans]
MKRNSSILVSATFIAALLFSVNASAFGGKNNKRDNKRDNKKDSRRDSRRGDKKGSHDSVPLDGGLGILVLGAAAFGVKKLRDNK